MVPSSFIFSIRSVRATPRCRNSNKLVQSSPVPHFPKLFSRPSENLVPSQSEQHTLSGPGKADVSVDLILPVRLLLELDKSESDRSRSRHAGGIEMDAGAGRLLRFLATLEKVVS